MEPHDEHLTAEMIARYWRGEISREEFTLFVVGHLAHRCPPCRGELDAVQTEVRTQRPSWSNRLAWRQVEHCLAAELPSEKKRQQRAIRELGYLRRLSSWDERAQRIAQSWRWYRSEETALALLQESRSCLPGDPEAAIEWSHLALEVASRAGNADRPFRAAWLLAQAYYGNALRVRGRLREAEDVFTECQRFAREQLHGEPYALAESRALYASLLRDVGEFALAEEVLASVLTIYQHLQEARLEGSEWITLSSVYYEAGRLDKAEHAARRAYRIFKKDPATWERLISAHALAVLLSQSPAGQTEASALYSAHRPLYQKFPVTENHRLWLCGMLAVGRGAYEDAHRDFDRARHGFLTAQNLYDAARVGLELGLVFHRMGATSEMVALAAAVVEEFSRIEAANREAVAARIRFDELRLGSSRGSRTPPRAKQD